jgi:translocation and assembly module TamB
MVVPPAGRTLLTRSPASWEAVLQALPPEFGPERDVSRFPAPTAVGGEFTYRLGPEWLNVEPSHLATERTYVEFEGRTAYGERSEFPFYARSADWQESDRLMAGILTAVGSPTGVINVGGHGEFRGTMTKAFKNPLIEGDFVGRDLRAWDVVWGHAAARLSIESGYVNVSKAAITSGRSTIDVDGKFSLGFPRKDGGEEINARFVLKDRPMRDLRHAFQLDDWPLEGSVSGEFRLWDKYTRPWGYGRLAIVDASAWGEPLDRASSPLRFQGQGVRLDAVEILKSGGTMTGAAYVGWDGKYSFDAVAERIPLDQVASVKVGAAEWKGQLHFSASGASTFKNPRYDVQMGAEDVSFGGEAIGAVVIGFGVKGHLITIDQLEAAGLGVSGSGQVEMSDAVDADLSFRFNKTLLDPYVRRFEPRLSPYTRAAVSGSVRVVGQLANWDRLAATATVDALDVSLFDYQIWNDGPIRLAFENNTLTAQQFNVLGNDTRLEVKGGISLKDDRIGVTVSGDANLGILQGFFRDVRSSGHTVLRGAINGSLSKPEFSGAAEITDGRLRHMSLPQSLQAINGRVTFSAEGISLDGLTAQISGGKVRFGGGIELNGYTVGQLGVSVSGENMEFRYPEGFRSTLDAQLDLVGTMAAPILRGTVTVKSALYNKRLDLIPGLTELVGGRSPAPSSSGVPTGVPLRFDVRIQAPSSVRIENNFAHIVAGADLSLRGSYDRPVLDGRIAVERGEAIIEGKRYMVRRCDIDFINPTKIEPSVDIEAETLIRVPGQTYVVNVQLSGTFDRITKQLTSDPPLSQLEIAALLFGGDPANVNTRNAELQTLQKEATQRDLATSRLQQAAIGVVSLPLTRAVEETFALDTVQITPNLAVDPNQRLNPTARLTVGKRISNKIYLTFSRSLNTAAGGTQVILLEYDHSDRLSLIFSRNEDGTYAMDVRVRHVF